MATTNPQTRLDRLFAKSPLPPAPPAGQLHFSEKELAEKEAKEETQFRVGSTAEYPRQVKPPQKEEAQQAIDILTSSDEDDYICAFKKKPSMKAPTKNVKSKRRNMPEPDSVGHSEDAIVKPKGRIEYLARGKSTKHTSADPVSEPDSDDVHLPTADVHGNPVIGHFCQFTLAAKFPYKYMSDTNDRVSRHFFASNKFYSRNWDLYYLHPPFSLSIKPIYLVPYAQFQQLVTEIGQTFKVPVSVPKFPFTLTFFDDGTPQPIFLGKSNSRDDVNNLQNNVPAVPMNHGECPDDAPVTIKQAFEDFKDMCQTAISAKGKNKSGVDKSRREDDRLLSIKDWYVQLRRAQRYLGLRRKTGQIQHPDPAMSWEEQEKFRHEQLKRAHFVLNRLNLNEPAPLPFEKEPVIIAIDVESYERAHNLITEIGISTLDTLDLVGLPPGPNGKNWLNEIRSRHFRISGREHLVNRDFCAGHPDAFQFGQSELVDLKEAVAIVDSCFEWPFSVQFKHDSLDDQWTVEPAKLAKENNTQRRVSNDFGGVYIGPTNAEQDAASRAAIANVLKGIENTEADTQAVEPTGAEKSDPESLQQGPQERNIVLVGHDIRADVQYLRDLGSKIFTPSRATYPIPAMDMMANGEGKSKVLASIIDSMDTAPLYRVFKEETQNRSLSSIMSDLGLPCYFPHNGGNDARYTLEAWVAMLIQARIKSDKNQHEEDHGAENKLETLRENDAWNTGSEWHVTPLPDPGRPTTPDDKTRKQHLDSFEAAIMASSPEASPQHAQDNSVVAMIERLNLDPSVDHEEPRVRLY
ncbi:hypothetical protein A1O7_00662 [Cladophialophora yegresii CBS 114405]|uniref:Gfd2/YDR514C-like C-terminal domain-containing protein n=1 Tax=Cladophialophora yegresii CBS 114405 TaxID=1182544 RepID=W9WI89_9EURO|nr:uncharacterized protein A1O7_00662 [Cladophialophora yegresii CBS 114405]EXJ64326.1 hypothetical protein A1O7_00662 [Cladophialophora yegresii CBS 114405]